MASLELNNQGRDAARPYQGLGFEGEAEGREVGDVVVADAVDEEAGGTVDAAVDAALTVFLDASF